MSFISQANNAMQCEVLLLIAFVRNEELVG